MQIGTFRRNVVRTLATKATKVALRTVSKNTVRTQVAAATVSLKAHTGRLLQVLGGYVLGLQQTQEMKDEASTVLGDIGADLAVLARTLKVKLPSSTKKIKLVGTRGAAILQLDSQATDLLNQAKVGLFTSPQMTTIKKMVSIPQKGGAKEERTVDVVNAEAEAAAELGRQAAMKSYLSGAIDVYWRLCYDITGNPPVQVLDAKFARLKKEFPKVEFDSGEKKAKAAPKSGPVAVKGKKTAKKTKAKATETTAVPA